MLKINNLKKAAMFGLDFEPLRKQFGELFLAKRQSEAPQGANGSCGLIKHGAMFGLDARIALAIFGALSVISGAALYSAVQQAKAVQWQTYFNELTKASEAYYLDTGREIPLTANSTYSVTGLWLSTRDLVVNDDNVVGWNGPYISSKSHGSTADQDYFIRDFMTSSIDSDSSNRLWLRKTSVWSSDIDTSPYNYSDENCASGDSDCAEWWVVYPVGGADELLNIYNLLDDKVDNKDGRYSGLIRYSTADSGILLVRGRQRVYRG